MARVTADRPPSVPVLAGRFDHVAIAAPRLRDLLPLYADLLGGRPIWAGDSERYGYRATQLAYPDDSVIELMEPLNGSPFFTRFFARNGGGFHHATFLVDDLRPAIAAAQEGGWDLVGERADDPSWGEVFIHPRSNHGALIQLAETDGTWVPHGAPPSIEEVLAGQRGNGQASP